MSMDAKIFDSDARNNLAPKAARAPKAATKNKERQRLASNAATKRKTPMQLQKKNKNVEGSSRAKATRVQKADTKKEWQGQLGRQRQSQKRFQIIVQ